MANRAPLDLSKLTREELLSMQETAPLSHDDLIIEFMRFFNVGPGRCLNRSKDIWVALSKFALENYSTVIPPRGTFGKLFLKHFPADRWSYRLNLYFKPRPPRKVRAPKPIAVQICSGCKAKERDYGGNVLHTTTRCPILAIDLEFWLRDLKSRAEVYNESCVRYKHGRRAKVAVSVQRKQRRRLKLKLERDLKRKLV